MVCGIVSQNAGENMNDMKLAEMEYLIGMKKRQPEKYRQLLEDYKGIMKDLLYIVKEVSEEILLEESEWPKKN
jgi:hypothetical protein